MLNVRLSTRDVKRALRGVDNGFRNRESALNHAIEQAKAFADESGAMAPRDALRFTSGLGLKLYERLTIIDKLMTCYGVETFDSVGGLWEYANTGDTYAETVVCSPKGKFIVSSVGNIQESPSHDRFYRRNER